MTDTVNTSLARCLWCGQCWIFAKTEVCSPRCHEALATVRAVRPDPRVVAILRGINGVACVKVMRCLLGRSHYVLVVRGAERRELECVASAAMLSRHLLRGRWCVNAVFANHLFADRACDT